MEISYFEFWPPLLWCVLLFLLMTRTLAQKGILVFCGRWFFKIPFCTVFVYKMSGQFSKCELEQLLE